MEGATYSVCVCQCVKNNEPVRGPATCCECDALLSSLFCRIFGLLQAAFSNGQVLLVSDEQCTMFIAVEGLHLVVTVTASSTVWRVSIRESEENPSIRAIESMTQDTFNHIVEVCATAGYTLHENGCLEVEVTVPPIDAASIGPRLSDMMATFRVNARKVLKVRVNMIIGQHLNGTGPGGVAQSHQPPTPPAAPVAVPVAAPHPPPPPPLADRLEKPTTLIINRLRAGSSFLFEGEYDGRSAFVRVVSSSRRCVSRSTASSLRTTG